MSLYKVDGDITSATDGFIIDGRNCLGVMGSGVALSIKNKWPGHFKDYEEYVNNAKSLDWPPWDNTCYMEYLLGKIVVTEYVNLKNENYYVGGIFTQKVFPGARLLDGSIEPRSTNKVYFEYPAFRAGLLEIEKQVLASNCVPVINLPYIGCGLARGESYIMEEILKDTAERVDVILWSYK